MKGSMTRKVLIVDSDGDQSETIAIVCRERDFSVDVVPHERTLAHLSKHAADYCAVLVRVTPQPSTLSAAARMGEFVLRYVAQALPELLDRTIVLTVLTEEERTNLPAVRRIFGDPFDPAALVAEIDACGSLVAEEDGMR